MKSLCETEDHLRNLQQRFRRLTEAFARLEGENSDLKSTVENLTEEKNIVKEKSIAKEAALKEEICSLTATVEERGREVAELARRLLSLQSGSLRNPVAAGRSSHLQCGTKQSPL